MLLFPTRARVSVGFRPNTGYPQDRLLHRSHIRKASPSPCHTPANRSREPDTRPRSPRRIIPKIWLRWAIDTRRYYDLNVNLQVCLRF